MKRSIAVITALMLFFSSFGQIALYLGARGGVGDMLTHDQLSDGGASALTRNNNGWSSHFKGEALLGFGRFRFGYQFLYNFSSPSIGGFSATPPANDAQYTTYVNASKTHFFGHYLLVELAIINTKHFALTPGVAIGSFTGYKVDNTSDGRVSLSETTHHRFSIGAELNAEIKFAKRWTILFGPNYYMFSLQDKARSDWHEYMHFFGFDIGLRVNLLGVSE